MSLAVAPPEGKPFLIPPNGAFKDPISECPHAATAILWSEKYRVTAIAMLPCKRWGCVWCGRRRVRRFALKCEAAAPNRLLTLTTDAKQFITPREAYDHARKAWSALTVWWRRHHGELAYFRVLESHKNGYPHFHACLRSAYVAQAQLSTKWAELHHSPIVDIRRIKKKAGVFCYVTKYLSKQTYISYTNRRLSWSRNFFPKEEKPAPPLGRLDIRQRLDSPPSLSLLRLFPGRVAEQLTPTLWMID